MNRLMNLARTQYRAWLCDQCGTWNEHDSFNCRNCLGPWS